MSVRYFALVGWDEDVDAATGLFRRVERRGTYSLFQHVDRGGEWRDNPELLRFFIFGEFGCVEVTPAKAREIVGRLGVDADRLIDDGFSSLSDDE